MRSKFVVMTTLSLFIVACKPAYTNNITNIPGNNPYKKISDEQVTEFTNVTSAMGRMEELVRVMLGRGATWGFNDASIDFLKTAINGRCVANMKEANGPRALVMVRTIELTGVSCPITFKFIFEFEKIPSERNKFSLTGSYSINDDTLVGHNLVKTLAITSYKGSYQDRREGPGLPTFDMNFSGAGTATLADGKQYVFSTHDQQYSETTRSGLAQNKSGFIRITTPGQFAINLESDGRTYKLNDRFVSSDTYRDFFARMGSLANAYRIYSEKF